MDNAKPLSIPLANHFKLSIAQCPKINNEVKNRSRFLMLVRWCLMYIMVCIRPDLTYAVNAVSKFLSNPGRQHWKAFKWIFIYLKGITDYGIMFSEQHGGPSIVGYIDVDYARDLDDRRSTTSYVFALVGGLFVGINGSVSGCIIYYQIRIYGSG